MRRGDLCEDVCPILEASALSEQSHAASVLPQGCLDITFGLILIIS